MARAHFSNQCVELLDCRQRDFFAAHWRALHGGCGVAINDATFNGDVENVPKNRDRVVVASRGCLFGVCARPFFAIGLRDPANLGFAQARPAFLKRRKTLSPVIPRARFNAQIVIEISQMNRSGFAKCHLGRDFAVAVASPLAVLFKKFGQLCFGHAEM